MFLDANKRKGKSIVAVKLLKILPVSIALIFGIVGCSQKAEFATNDRIDLNFVLMHKQLQMLCDAKIDMNAKQWRVDKFAFFVSNVSLGTEGGKWFRLTSVPSDWQTEHVSLIDFPTKCSDEEAKNAHTSVKLRLPNGIDAKSIKFSLYVPFEQNHLNPLIQAPPLNNSDMFWSWRQGHKFMRIDMKTTGDDWLFHLGSVACESVAVVRAPLRPCKQPNQYEIVLPLLSNHNLVSKTKSKIIKQLDVLVHLDRLFDNAAITSQKSCMFMQSQLASCKTLTNNLVNNRVFTWR